MWLQISKSSIKNIFWHKKEGKKQQYKRIIMIFKEGIVEAGVDHKLQVQWDVDKIFKKTILWHERRTITAENMWKLREIFEERKREWITFSVSGLSSIILTVFSSPFLASITESRYKCAERDALMISEPQRENVIKIVSSANESMERPPLSLEASNIADFLENIFIFQTPSKRTMGHSFIDGTQTSSCTCNNFENMNKKWDLRKEILSVDFISIKVSWKFLNERKSLRKAWNEHMRGKMPGCSFLHEWNFSDAIRASFLKCVPHVFAPA